jgi:uncharacterized Fe-S cluster protein YjdI
MSDERGRPYQGNGVAVFYDVERCVHFAECVRGLPTVFDTSRRPWIQADAEDAEIVAEVIRRCPSGALQYALDGGPVEEPVHPTTVTRTDWGPIVLRGDLRLVTAAPRRAERDPDGHLRLWPDGALPALRRHLPPRVAAAHASQRHTRSSGTAPPYGGTGSGPVEATPGGPRTY